MDSSTKSNISNTFSVESVELSFIFDNSIEVFYDRNDIIGWGAFSFNFCGKIIRKGTTEAVAIKEIKLKSLIDPYDALSLQSAMNEVAILRNLKHKNIVKFIGFHQMNDDRLIIIQKKCNQGDMGTFLTKHQFMSQEGVLHFFLQMIDGFKYLIDQNVFHGDIKPENIFLHKDKVKIGDFGMSVKFKKPTDTYKELRGSPGFMSPEILNGEEYTIESDVWALGVTLYFLIYGQTPWGDIKNPIRLQKHLKNLKEQPNEFLSIPEKWSFPVSAELKTLIRRMIVYDVKKRITWDGLFKYKALLMEKNKKFKPGVTPLLYKKKGEKGGNQAMDNYCSPMLLIDATERNVINQIKVWESHSKYCKTEN